MSGSSARLGWWSRPGIGYKEEVKLRNKHREKAWPHSEFNILGLSCFIIIEIGADSAANFDEGETWTPK
jgi:hypothetical protein